jgi:type IV pilus assembly protein PilO
MRRDFKLRRKIILGGVIALVLADVVLAGYSWHLSSSPHAPQQQFAQEQLQLKLLRGNIERAQKIRNDMPNIQKDCDKFERSLPPAGSGYSYVTSELGGVARKTGIHLESLAFKETKIASRRMNEVAVDATVSGDYKSVIGFLNSLQRSSSLYAVDSLTLATDNGSQGSGGIIKVALHLRTYFRTLS